MNLRKLPKYAGAAVRRLVRSRPVDLLRLLARSPYVVQHLPDLGVDMVVDTRDSAISRPILCIGEYEKSVWTVLSSFVREDTRFVDVGANLGFFSVAVASRASQGIVWSFEPDPGNYRLLTTNIALNGLQSVVRPMHRAVSDAEGSLYFSDLGNTTNLGARFTAKEEATLLAHAAPGTPRPTRVEAIVLDNLLAGETIDLVKVDVEGFEPAVFRGMRKILAAQRPVVVTEFAPGTIQHISGSDPGDMLRDLVELGYSIDVIGTDGSLAACGVDIGRVLDALPSSSHHLDLLLRPTG